MDEITGVIYPVPMKFVVRLFDGKTKVFVKYVAHNTTKLKPKHKVIFYGSHGLRKLIGEGTIEKVEFLTPEAILSKYRNELFLNQDELQAYVGNSTSRAPSKEMLTLVMRKMKRYSAPLDYDKPITMAGQYLTSSEYDHLTHKL
jgi:hypothetical protein